jgi:hypothetical protein
MNECWAALIKVSSQVREIKTIRCRHGVLWMQLELVPMANSSTNASLQAVEWLARERRSCQSEKLFIYSAYCGSAGHTGNSSVTSFRHGASTIT